MGYFLVYLGIVDKLFLLKGVKMVVKIFVWLGMYYLVFIVIMGKCVGVFFSYFFVLNSGYVECDELIESYFKIGFGYDEILLLLGLLYGIVLSIC